MSPVPTARGRHKLLRLHRSQLDDMACRDRVGIESMELIIQ